MEKTTLSLATAIKMFESGDESLVSFALDNYPELRRGTKKYVHPNKNRVPSYMERHINVGYTVIVVDGSFMVEVESGKPTFGINFIRDGLYELLTVVAVNQSFPTSNRAVGCLTPQNNCCIQGGDGKRYYCSGVNIIAYNKHHLK